MFKFTENLCPVKYYRRYFELFLTDEKSDELEPFLEQSQKQRQPKKKIRNESKPLWYTVTREHLLQSLS